MKKRLFSGIQPTNIVHIGNYLGAITQFVQYQNDYDSLFCIVDYHAITVPQNPNDLQKNIIELIALYLACDINPKKAAIFVQSHIPEHTELAWILNTITYIGELNRMTQYKEKSIKYSKNKRTVGLYDYPVLMAADILLYNTDFVPVGEDQIQHVELTRDIAKRFNKIYGDTFKIPKVLTKEGSARIMGLDNPEKKMSKSAQSSLNYIALTDSPDIIRKKIARAVTDSQKNIRFDPNRKGLFNMMNIYNAFSGIGFEEIEKKYLNKGYKEFKEDLATIIIEKLNPIQKKYFSLIEDHNYLYKIIKEGSQKVAPVAQKNLSNIKKKIGLI